MSLILDKVNYIFGENTAFETPALLDINLVIGEGEFIGVIGRTGSGKSTLIQHMNGLLKATSGAVYFNGEDIYDRDFKMKKLRSKVGLVFQYPEHQLFETSVIKDVSFGPKNLGLENLEVDMRSFGALKSVGIGDDLLDASPFELSGGQKRRVAIAGVLAMQPDILILDEPTAGLDPRGKKDILDLIAKIRRERGISVILVSHSMEDVAEYVDRLVVMSNGRIVMDGPKREIFARFKELEKIGLAAPQVTYICAKLREAGLDIKELPITVEEAKESIMRALGRQMR